MSKIKKLSYEEFNKLSSFEGEEGKPVYNMKSCYQTFDNEVSKLIDIIESQLIEIDQLKNTKKKMPKAFDHATDKKVRAKAVKMLNDRYTVKATALALGLSESTVNRIKKAEGLTTPIVKKKK